MSTPPHLSRRLTLEARGHLDDGAGGWEPSWATLGVLWAHVAPRSGRERTGRNGPLSQMSYKITVRAAPIGDPQRPKPEQRLRDGSRVFHIRAVSEQDAQGLYLTLYADEEMVA